MKVAVVGTGAMGSVYAGLLGAAGHEVWAVDRWAEHVDAIAASGLRVSGASGDRVVEGISAGSRPADVGEADLWLIATKAADVEAVAAEIAPLLRPDDLVMAFQNGLGAGERVARHVPEDHVLVGIAEGFGSSIPEPGHVPSETQLPAESRYSITRSSPESGCSLNVSEPRRIQARTRIAGTRVSSAIEVVVTVLPRR